jgi:hypothetical protein
VKKQISTLKRTDLFRECDLCIPTDVADYGQNFGDNLQHSGENNFGAQPAKAMTEDNPITLHLESVQNNSSFGRG